ncbi:hypothetical protein V1506DRAFT_506549 [Lipomyces tetrasporus]
MGLSVPSSFVLWSVCARRTPTHVYAVLSLRPQDLGPVLYAYQPKRFSEELYVLEDADFLVPENVSQGLHHPNPGLTGHSLAILPHCIIAWNTALAIPLVEHALGTEFSSQAWNDEGFWNTVLNFVTQIEATPPAVFEKATFDTPPRSSSASQSGIEQTHGEVDQRILEELTGASTTMSKVSTSDFSKGRRGQIRHWRYTNFQWHSMPGAGGPNPRFKRCFLSGLKLSKIF